MPCICHCEVIKNIWKLFCHLHSIRPFHPNNLTYAIIHTPLLAPYTLSTTTSKWKLYSNECPHTHTNTQTTLSCVPLTVRLNFFFPARLTSLAMLMNYRCYNINYDSSVSCRYISLSQTQSKFHQKQYLTQKQLLHSKKQIFFIFSLFFWLHLT